MNFWRRWRVAVDSILALEAGYNIICECDWSEVYSTDDITAMYEAFLVKCRTLIDCCIPVKMVSLGPRDPEFVTPLIKSLLKARNKLRRGGQVEQANTLAIKNKPFNCAGAKSNIGKAGSW